MMDIDTDNADLAHGLSVVIGRLARQLRSHYQHRSALTLSQLSVLNVLASDGRLTLGELAARERVQPPSMTRTVQSLVRLGMVRRDGNPDDARIAILGLTGAGHEALDNDRQARESWLDRQLEALTDYERDTLAEAATLLDELRTAPDNQMDLLSPVADQHLPGGVGVLGLLPPLPPFTAETAAVKVQAAEDAWNTCDPELVARAYTEDAHWRSRGTVIDGAQGIIEFLTAKWEHEQGYTLRKHLWAYTGNRIAVRFEYEWHDESGQWWRSYGNELWEFTEEGLISRHEASINDLQISGDDRRIFGSRHSSDS